MRRTLEVSHMIKAIINRIINRIIIVRNIIGIIVGIIRAIINNTDLSAMAGVSQRGTLTTVNLLGITFMIIDINFIEKDSQCTWFVYLSISVLLRRVTSFFVYIVDKGNTLMLKLSITTHS